MTKESTKAAEELSEQQRKFVEHYLDLNTITKSAIMAGYSEASAHTSGSRLLKMEKVQRYINALQEERRQHVHNALAKYAREAVVEMARLAKEAESENVRAIAIKDIMDRAGYKPTEKIDQTGKLDAKIEFGFVDPATKQ